MSFFSVWKIISFT